MDFKDLHKQTFEAYRTHAERVVLLCARGAVNDLRCGKGALLRACELAQHLVCVANSTRQRMTGASKERLAELRSQLSDAYLEHARTLCVFNEHATSLRFYHAWCRLMEACWDDSPPDYDWLFRVAMSIPGGRAVGLFDALNLETRVAYLRGKSSTSGNMGPFYTKNLVREVMDALNVVVQLEDRTARFDTYTYSVDVSPIRFMHMLVQVDIKDAEPDIAGSLDDILPGVFRYIGLITPAGLRGE